MFDCTHCGHSEMVHVNYVGRCVHGQIGPKDGLDCDCPRMDFRPDSAT